MDNTATINNKNTMWLAVLGVSLFSGIFIFKNTSYFNVNSETLNGFATVFVSMVLEAMPFIIMGSLVSSLIQIFITEDLICKIIPKNIFLGTIAASIVGLFFPICECTIVPISRSLIKKGVPMSIATTFMLAVPIVNPVVLVSTYYAFLGDTYMVFIRAFIGIVVSIVIGLLVGKLYKEDPIKSRNSYHNNDCNCVNCNSSKYDSQNKISRIINSTSYEFYNIGRFFIVGAFLSSIMQSFVPRASIASIGKGELSSIIIMMIIAFMLSICSETDAFIARTFLGQFTIGSIVVFLILGPMLDIKNTIMIFGNFKKTYAIWLIALVISICFIVAVVCNLVNLILISYFIN